MRKRTKSPAASRRAALLAEVERAARESSTASVLLHGAIAERLGLSATDEKTLEVLDRLGPLTAGDLARHTGLATASVTSLIDRLEAKGFVRRVRDTADRRRVIVERTTAHDTELAAIFGPVQAGFAKSLDRYTEPQLEAIADFLTRGAVWAREHTARITSRPT